MGESENSSFGTLLRQYRLAAGLSQKLLAKHARLSVDAIAALERGRRTTPHVETVAALAEALRLAASERQHFITTAVTRHQRCATLPHSSKGAVPLPPTPLVNRAHEIAAIRHLLELSRTRLVTLTGPGGVGKTRLAVAVAAMVQREFTNGATFIDLSAIHDPALVAPLIAQILGLRETAAKNALELVKNHLHPLHMLLVLDNFEQIVDAALLVSDLLAACPRLICLVTSRTALCLQAEQRFIVPPLDTPGAHAKVTIAEIERYTAVQLFVSRAQAVQPAFELNHTNATTIADICRCLDGLPLAIELAAARCALLTPQVLLQQLKRQLPVLTGGSRDMPARQRTLRATLDWSYSLLKHAEQMLLWRLAIFAGGASLDAIEAICLNDKSDAPTIGDMFGLVEQSLVRAETDVAGQPRYTMLEVIREYADECLRRSGEVHVLRQAHAMYFVTLAEHAEPRLRGVEQHQWLERLEQEQDNIRVALEWACVEQPSSDVPMRLVAALWQFWRLRGHTVEGVMWTERVLAQSAQITPQLQTRALNHLAYLHVRQGHYERAAALARDSKALAQSVDRSDEVAWAFGILGHVAMVQGNYAEAGQRYRASLQLTEQTSDHWLRAWLLEGYSKIVLEVGDVVHAIELCHASLELYNRLIDSEGRARVLDHVGRAYWWQHDLEQAESVWQLSFDHYAALGDRQGMGWMLNHLGDLARQQANDRLAHQRYSQALDIFQEIADTLGRAAVLQNLGHLACNKEAYQEARTVFIESLTIFHNLKHVASVADGLAGFARVLQLTGEGKAAVRLLSVVSRWRDAVDPTCMFVTPVNRIAWEQTLRATHATLAIADFTVAWQEATALALDEAVDEVLATAGENAAAFRCNGQTKNVQSRNEIGRS